MAKSSRETILIVDDDKDLARMLALRFEGRGYKALIASDGAATLSAFRKKNPDLVLMDLHMPRLDGQAVLRELREIDPEIAIIIMTADMDADRASELLKDGAMEFLVKPLDFEVLDRSILAALARRKASR